MTNKFISWLENIPAELKKFFTNPVVESIATGGLTIAGLVDPALLPLTTGITAAVARAEALAAAANVQTGSGPQKLAMALADAQEAFQAYEQSTGVTIETAQQAAIVNAIVAMLNSIPAPASAAPVTTSTAPVASTSVAVPPSPSVQSQVAAGTLL